MTAVAGWRVAGAAAVAAGVLAAAAGAAPALLERWAPAAGGPVGAPARATAVRTFAGPTGAALNGVAWLNDREIAVSVMAAPFGSSVGRLHLLSLERGGFAPVALPDDPDCRFTTHHFPVRLADGRLGYLQRCWVSLTPERRLPQEGASVMAYDPAAGTAAPLVPYRLHFAVNTFDFDPRVEVGIANDGAGVREGLVWLRAEGEAPVGALIGAAGAPRWSPDGSRIAVVGTDLPAGWAPPQPLPRAAETVYLLGRDGSAAPLVRRVDARGLLSWSPDGRWLAVVLRPTRAPEGLWLINVASGRLRLVAAGGGLGWPDWSPDGRRLAALRGVDAGGDSIPRPSEVVVWDLPALDPPAG